MNSADIFNAIAKENLRNYNFGKFKKEYPTLFAVIMVSMDNSRQAGYNEGFAAGKAEGMKFGKVINGSHPPKIDNNDTTRGTNE